MSDPITRLNVALAGRYLLERQLGEGGMATVYLAKDLRHERQVALKVLKPEIAVVVGAERFLAEIKTTANLQHPHILPLFDSGEADSFLFYVMPHVEGETLRDRIDRQRQLPVDEAVGLAKKLADALDHAHGRGVIHRDIKPANVLLSERGEPLIADFGIALAVGAAEGHRLTETGLSLGTPYYMSPEQATGDQTVGPETDIYALGCVLYEMLVGDPPFSGSTAQAVLGQILTGTPDRVTEHRKAVPANVEATISKALEKLPADRHRKAQDFAKSLADTGFRYGDLAGQEVVEGASPWKRRSWFFAGCAGIMALALAWSLSDPTPEVTGVPFRMTLSGFQMVGDQDSGEHIAISPDGSRFVLASSENGVERLYIRRAGELGVAEIPGTEGGSHPTFSPDGKWLAFQAGGEVRRLELAGGPVLTVADGAFPHWGLQDTIVFSREGAIYQVSPSGRSLTFIADVAPSNWPRPSLLPDGGAVLFQGSGDLEARQLKIVELGSGVVRDLGVAGSNPRYVSTGHVLYGHASQALWAVPFDLRTQSVTGTPLVVLPEVMVLAGGATQFAVSATGTAVFGLPGTQDRRLVIVDQAGTETPLPPTGDLNHPRFSPPDGAQIAYESGNHIWVYDVGTGANSRLTSGWNYQSPWWSRDGEWIYYSGWTGTSARYDGFRRLADASQEEEHLYRLADHDYPLAQSTSGTQILIETRSRQRGRDLLLVTDSGENPVFSEYLRADWNETTGTISPDGAWVAYVSDESGQREVYLRSFPDGDGQRGISQGGGIQPVWGPDGSAIYYRDGVRVMRATLTTGAAPSVVLTETLFEVQWLNDDIGRHDWDIHPNGRSFVAVRGPTTQEAEIGGIPIIPVRVVVNWFEELRQRMGR